MFESLQRSTRHNGKARLLALLASLAAHGAILALIVILPLVFFHAMPGVNLIAFLIAAPPVPTAPPPPPPKLPVSQKVQDNHIIVEETDLAPTKLPDGLPPPTGEPPLLYSFAVVTLHGLTDTGAGPVGASVIHDRLLGTAPLPVPPPPPPPPPKILKPVVIGGKVQEAKLIRKILPEYPAIARTARISGEVVLEITVDEEGNVTSLKVLRGHPTLVEEALRVVQQWKYSPTLLNGEPVPVLSFVTIVFRLQ